MAYLNWSWTSQQMENNYNGETTDSNKDRPQRQQPPVGETKYTVLCT